MNNSEQFDLRDFQQRVFKRYNDLMRQIDAASTPVKGAAILTSDSNTGPLYRFVKKRLRSFEKYVGDRYFENPAIIGRQIKADEIIGNPKIKTILIPFLKRKPWLDFFKEEAEIELILTVTSCLTKKTAIEEFSIERDAELFAAIIHKVLETGVENYCSDIDDIPDDIIIVATASGSPTIDQDKHGEEIINYTKAIEANSHDDDAYFNRGLAYFDEGEYDLAIADFTAVLRIDPTLTNLYYYRGDAYFALGKYDQAIVDLTEFLRGDLQDIDPEHINYASYTRGRCYYNRGDYDLALADLTNVIENDQEDEDSYFCRAFIYDQLGDTDLAIADYAKVLDLNPQNSSAQYNRGRAYSMKGVYDLAIFDFNEVVKIDPKHVNAIFSRGTAHYYQDEYEQAIADYSRAVEIDPEFTDAYSARALTYCKLGKKALAKADELKVAELGGILIEKCS